MDLKLEMDDLSLCLFNHRLVLLLAVLLLVLQSHCQSNENKLCFIVSLVSVQLVIYIVLFTLFYYASISYYIIHHSQVNLKFQYNLELLIFHYTYIYIIYHIYDSPFITLYIHSQHLYTHITMEYNITHSIQLARYTYTLLNYIQSQ